MNFRNITQKALRKTASTLLSAESKLEPTPNDELIALLKTADIPAPILISTLDYLQNQLESLEVDNA